MPVAVPGVLVCAFADDTGHNHIACQRVVWHGANTHVVHHRAFHLDVVYINGLALAVGSLFKRPNGQHVVARIGNFLVLRTYGILIDHDLPFVWRVVPADALGIVGPILAFKLHHYVVLVGHFQTEGYAAQSFEVGIAHGECRIVVFLVPAAGVVLERHLQTLVAIVINYGRICTVPESAIASHFLVLAVP